MEHTNEQLLEKFKSLPKDIQDMITEEDFGPAITLLCGVLGVDATKALDVEDEIFNVLVGFSHPKDFIRNIQSKTGVDQEKARAIAEKVNEEIFQPVRESLKIVHGIKNGEQKENTPLPTPPKPPSPPTQPSAEPKRSASPELIVPKPGEAPKPSQNIFEQKLQGMYKMPKEETLVPPRPTNNPQPTTDNQQRGGVDPYREPAK